VTALWSLLVRVRRATVDDAQAIAEVHVRTWQAAYRQVFPREQLDALSVREREQRWRQNLVGADNATFVGERDGRVAGFATIGPSEEASSEGHLFAIYVLPDGWGSGLASLLMTTAAAELERRGYAEATLWVFEDNPRARRFYELSGWSLDGAEREGEHLGVRTHEIRYRKRLG
jgi:ribosomal protein S18 acetylase RimI-like enzyme